MSLSKIDQAVSVIRFLIKKKRKRIDEIGRKVAPSESEKIFIGQELEMIQNTEVLIQAVTGEVHKMLGKLPPQATDLEVSVLGAAILEGNALAKINSFLKVDHFYLEKHRLIYGAVIALQKASQPVDMRTVVAQLRKQGHLEAAGGATYVAELTSTVSSASNIEAHARIMIEYAVKRELLLMAGELIGEAYEDSSDCFDLIDQAKKRLNTIDEWTK